MQLQGLHGENRTHDPAYLVRRSANWATKAIAESVSWVIIYCICVDAGGIIPVNVYREPLHNISKVNIKGHFSFIDWLVYYSKYG